MGLTQIFNNSKEINWNVFSLEMRLLSKHRLYWFFSTPIALEISSSKYQTQFHYLLSTSTQCFYLYSISLPQQWFENRSRGLLIPMRRIAWRFLISGCVLFFSCVPFCWAYKISIDSTSSCIVMSVVDIHPFGTHLKISSLAFRKSPASRRSCFHQNQSQYFHCLALNKQNSKRSFDKYVPYFYNTNHI